MKVVDARSKLVVAPNVEPIYFVLKQKGDSPVNAVSRISVTPENEPIYFVTEQKGNSSSSKAPVSLAAESDTDVVPHDAYPLSLYANSVNNQSPPPRVTSCQSQVNNQNQIPIDNSVSFFFILKSILFLMYLLMRTRMKNQ